VSGTSTIFFFFGGGGGGGGGGSSNYIGIFCFRLLEHLSMYYLHSGVSLGNIITSVHPHFTLTQQRKEGRNDVLVSCH
jgi:hypothetical protein